MLKEKRETAPSRASINSLISTRLRFCLPPAPSVGLSRIDSAHVPERTGLCVIDNRSGLAASAPSQIRASARILQFSKSLTNSDAWPREIPASKMHAAYVRHRTTFAVENLFIQHQRKTATSDDHGLLNAPEDPIVRVLPFEGCVLP